MIVVGGRWLLTTNDHFVFSSNESFILHLCAVIDR